MNFRSSSRYKRKRIIKKDLYKSKTGHRAGRHSVNVIPQIHSYTNFTDKALLFVGSTLPFWPCYYYKGWGKLARSTIILPLFTAVLSSLEHTTTNKTCKLEKRYCSKHCVESWVPLNEDLLDTYIYKHFPLALSGLSLQLHTFCFFFLSLKIKWRIGTLQSTSTNF